jgi:hypothetical protein
MTTYEACGAKHVWIAAPESGGDKRFGTLQVTAFAVDYPFRQPRLTMCFKGGGIRISVAERAAWSPEVCVMFQK